MSLTSRERAMRVARTFLMASPVASGWAEVEGEPSTIGWAVAEDGRLAISEVVGRHEGGVTLPPGALNEIGLAVTCAHTAIHEKAKRDAEERDTPPGSDSDERVVCL